MAVVYLIKNMVNNKIYVGSAYNFIKRKNIHLSTLRNQKHKNCKLQRAYNKYGENSFEFEIIQECDKKEVLLFEQHFIDTLRPFYNINLIANSRAGIKSSREHIEKIRIANTGKKHSDSTRKKLRNINLGKKTPNEIKEKLKNHSKNIEIYRYDLTGRYIDKHRSIREASRFVGVHNKGIRLCIKGKRNQSGGFIWKTRLEIFEHENISTKKEVIQYDEQMNEIGQFISIQEASRRTGINARKICACCKGQINKVHGYTWKYKK
jgi:group I intron endonuclease